jgi:small subunit ribosomal protein S6e
MKFNISNPETGQQVLIDLTDENRFRHLYDKKMGQEVEGDAFGDEWKGYIFRISGGNDKQGFVMQNGVLENRRVRLLLKKGNDCFRERRKGLRKRKSVRGCIIGHDLAVVSLVVVKKGEAEVPRLTDEQRPKRLGPKRASKIRKMFALDRGIEKGTLAENRDDVRRYVVRREITREGKPSNTKAPKIQRLITKDRIRKKLA